MGEAQSLKIKNHVVAKARRASEAAALNTRPRLTGNQSKRPKARWLPGSRFGLNNGLLRRVRPQRPPEALAGSP
jgi:hypothetical protein